MSSAASEKRCMQHKSCPLLHKRSILSAVQLSSGVLQTWRPLLHQTWVSYEIPVLVEPLEDAKDFFILAESRLASKDPRLPFCEKTKKTPKFTYFF